MHLLLHRAVCGAAVGVLTYDVLVGVPPFAAEEPNLTVQRVLTDDPVFPDELSDLACDFILCVSARA